MSIRWGINEMPQDDGNGIVETFHPSELGYSVRRRNPNRIRHRATMLTISPYSWWLAKDSMGSEGEVVLNLVAGASMYSMQG